MSTVKVNEVRHLSNSGTANVVLESNATTNLQATSTLGLTVTGTLTVSGVSTFNGNTVVGNSSTDTANLISKVTGFNNFSGFTGEIRMYAGNEGPNAPPTGWLYCNGDTISEESADGGTHYNADGKGNDYQPLFNLLKTNSNWGNSGSPSWGSTTVKLPDFRSRAPVGVHTGAANALPTGLTARTIGIGTSIADGSTLVGKETHALTVAELAVHTHDSTIVERASGQTISTITADQPTHRHTYSHTHNLSSHTHSFSGSPMGTHSHQSAVEGGTDFSQSGGINAAALSNLWHNTQAVSAGTPAGSISGPSPNITAGQSATDTGYTDPAITISGGVMQGETHGHTLTAVNAAHSGVSAAGTAHTILSPIIAVNYIIKV